MLVRLAACFRLVTVPIYKYFSLQLTVLFFCIKSVCFDNRIVGLRIFTEKKSTNTPHTTNKEEFL